jgi:rhodanese-related sulfurtransferase
MAITQTTPPEAHETLSQDAAVVYLDVRTEAEFQAGHPEPAINIPVVFFDQATGRPVPNLNFLTVVEATLTKEVTVVVGCQAGGRSQRAAEIMEQARYANVSNMIAGFGGGQDQMGQAVAGWHEAGLPVSMHNGNEVSYASLAEKADVIV